MRFISTIFLCLLLAFAAGCAADGSLVNPFGEEAPPPAMPYYFDEFPDVPIPNEMSKVAENSFLTYAGDNSKCGIVHYRARVEAGSLITSMRSNMASQNWTLRSFLRGKQSVLTFEKDSRVCTITISDDTIYTNMMIFIAPRLNGDTGDVGLVVGPAATSAKSGTSGTQALNN